MIIKTWRDPYEAGFSPTTPRQIELNPGLTVLVGCNGAGKSTLLLNIKEVAFDEKVPCHLWNNLSDGGSSNSLSSILGGFKEYDCDDLGLGISIWNSSEGEAIKLNIARDSTLYKEFLKTGHFKNKVHALASLFSDKANEEITDKRRIFLFDASDSGLSIDSVCELKVMLKSILDISDNLGLETYIVIAANEYELARGENCFDVNKGVYLTFKDYEDYRKFIIKSRERKDARIKKQEIWREKQKQKEIKGYYKLKEEVAKDLEELEEEYAKDNGISYRWQKEDILRRLEDYKRRCRYASFEDEK